MTTKTLLTTLLAALALCSCQSTADKMAAQMQMPPYKGSPAFEQMKTLVGKWTGDSPMGKLKTEFRLIAADSVIEERFGDGTPMAMVSMYHDVDGKLMMTHYCAARNQPRMALVKSTANSLTFDLVPTPGLNPAKDHHMHGGTFTFIDKDHFKMDGVAWKDGKPDAGCGPVIYTRR